MVSPIQTLKVVPIGNSKGVRLPRTLLVRYRIGDNVRVETTDKGILLSSVSDKKKSWEETFKAMSSANDDNFSDLNATIGDGLENL
jgi:antitoxin MazE